LSGKAGVKKDDVSDVGVKKTVVQIVPDSKSVNERDEFISSKPDSEKATYSINTLKQKMMQTEKAADNKSDFEKWIESIIKMMQKAAVEKAITKVLEIHGVNLEEDDVITMSINKEGKFAIDCENTTIKGKTGDEIVDLCEKITKDLNNEETRDGMILGEWLISQVAEEMGIDIKDLDKDFSFKIAFEFKQNENDLNVNEILHAHLTQDLDSFFMPEENEESEILKDKFFDNFKNLF
jgi:hypothetical protein